MDNQFTIIEQAHALAGVNLYYCDVRSSHYAGSQLWSQLHRAIKEAARSFIYELQREDTNHHQSGYSYLAWQEIVLELRRSMPFKKFEVLETESLDPGWLQYIINLQGNMVAYCEFALRSTNVEGENHAQRSNRAPDFSLLSSTSERGSIVSGGAEGRAFGEQRSPTPLESYSGNNSLSW